MGPVPPGKAGRGPAIAIDAMAGDRAPRELGRGAILAARERPGCPLILGGDSEEVREELRMGEWDGSTGEVAHSSSVMDMTDSPVEARRRKRDSSIEVATRLVKEGRAF